MAKKIDKVTAKLNERMTPEFEEKVRQAVIAEYPNDPTSDNQIKGIARRIMFAWVKKGVNEEQAIHNFIQHHKEY